MTTGTPLDARLTVAAVIESQSRFLTVVELDAGREVYSQPAGHVEHGESLVQGVVREVLEETGYACAPTHVVGVYLLTRPGRSTILRVCFACTAIGDSSGPRDPEILRTHWLTEAELRQVPPRGPLVMRSVEDYLAGHRYPLGLLDHLVLPA